MHKNRLVCFKKLITKVLGEKNNFFLNIYHKYWKLKLRKVSKDTLILEVLLKKDIKCLMFLQSQLNVAKLSRGKLEYYFKVT